MRTQTEDYICPLENMRLKGVMPANDIDSGPGFFAIYLS